MVLEAKAMPDLQEWNMRRKLGEFPDYPKKRQEMDREMPKIGQEVRTKGKK